NYNVFVFNNFTSSTSDTEGNLAAGGNVNVSNYSVASSIAGNTSQSPDPARLVAGGTVTATNGGVGNGQNGAIYANGTNLTSFTATGGSFVQSLVNFSSAQSQYQSLSTTWSTLATTGTTSSSFGTLNLSGTNVGLNVFSLNGSDLTNSNSININAPSNATVLINVSGTGEVFQNGQVTLTGVDPTHVIYNFYNSTALTLTGSKNPMGSILAPWAAVAGGYGQLYGQLIANSFNGNIEFHNYLFNGTIASGSSVPEPASLWLFGAALAFFARRGRKLA
ncbi:MAG: choice-of-anchor A family protein, partial [Methylovulum sp.]|nr:choice-of-anchor A family protein [Methylovulum sp.]